MNRTSGMLFAALLTLPAVSWAQEKEARVDRQKPAPQASFSISSENVREIVRAKARAEVAPASDNTPITPQRLAVKFTAQRHAADHTECDALQCYAYARDGVLLYSFPRDQLFGQVPANAGFSDAWLSCQDTNNLLSTFERFDKCRGVTTGLPLRWNHGAFEQPTPDATRD